MFLGFETFILPEHFHYFPHKRLCLEAKDRSKMLNEACLGKGRASDLGRRTWERREKGQVTGSHILTKLFENMSWRHKFWDPRKSHEASFGPLGVGYASQKCACCSFSAI